ncbi:MAG: rod shape-determining protein [Lachnospiraceae bacterium]|nr:rod shape-determining protein [Lachnospiraceae bacterium]
MEEVKKYQGKLVFGLDIGTRSIVGTVGYKTGDQFYVVAQRVREHETRAMLDGQIHDIGRVGMTIAQVKSELEAAIGGKLNDVCIAAAGRVLKTVTVHTQQQFEEEKEITAEDIYALDSKGIENAYDEFNHNNDSDVKFYCVGYSVMRYYMNNYVIGNLESHKAKEIGVDLIATFLPEDVVDGLYKAVGQAGLEVVNLTLEPIAAIQVAIPEMYRMLNIALVDVGAGTSDISITQGGSIVAYGMIPIAGDALTEVIAQHCLVDFATAEQIKRDCGEKEAIEYKDIMGLSQTISREELLTVVKPVVETMTKQVADKIKELNGDKAVSAVFVVGGGGKIPGYTETLAQELGIVPERVALRGAEVMQKIQFLEKETKKDSLLVTPIGICLSFYEQSNSFVFVTFNNRRIKLYDNARLAVVDAAMQADFPNESLFPKRGRALHFTLGGKSRMMRGQLGEAAVITVNGSAADIYTPIHANDVIAVQESTAGEAAHLTVSQLPEFGASISVIVNEKKITLPKFASVNGQLQSGYYDICENDEIEMLCFYTVRQIAEFMDVVINEQMNIYVNNKLADMDTHVFENFSVIWTMETLELSDVEQYEDAAKESASEEGSYADLPDGDGMEADDMAKSATAKNAAQTDPDAELAGEETEAAPRTPVTIGVTVNNRPIVLSGKPSYVFVDVFDYIDFDLSKPQGKGIVTRLNGKDAQYMEPLTGGDMIEIYWKE